MNNILSQFRQFMSNPSQYAARLGIPSNIQNDPQKMIQHLMDTGRLNQQQYNQIQQMARQFQSMMK